MLNILLGTHNIKVIENALRTNSTISFYLSNSLYRNNFGSTSLKKAISVVSLTKERNNTKHSQNKNTLRHFLISEGANARYRFTNK
ncbi:hypothetical protein BpHYR1_018674 [Brachionus plicatilis]|uniref:Uncharacterized protein n=1 Tax=Brachionus plicatilis TaxID=10195 RepID=A0A3M7T5W6_BRAPC|nr:hypothetical protein BpHYR1_018674 [Brachionus plicatilis]